MLLLLLLLLPILVARIPATAGSRLRYITSIVLPTTERRLTPLDPHSHSDTRTSNSCRRWTRATRRLAHRAVHRAVANPEDRARWEAANGILDAVFTSPDCF